MIVRQPPVTRYACGHVGRMNRNQVKHRGFIRVAEIRGAVVHDPPVDQHGIEYPEKKCPDCEK